MSIVSTEEKLHFLKTLRERADYGFRRKINESGDPIAERRKRDAYLRVLDAIILEHQSKIGEQLSIFA